MSKIMRISNETSNYLNELAPEIKVSKQEIIEKAVGMFAKKYFLHKTNREYAELRKNSSILKKESKEHDELDKIILDGLNK